MLTSRYKSTRGMKHRITLIITCFAIAVSVAASVMPAHKNFKNLQVLPKDISEHSLDSMMDAYSKALGVKCDFCHVKEDQPVQLFPTANEQPRLDFAKDGEVKNAARQMIRLQMDINSKYFSTDSLAKPAYLNTVHCNTCHRGNAYPDEH